MADLVARLKSTGTFAVGMFERSTSHDNIKGECIPPVTTRWQNTQTACLVDSVDERADISRSTLRKTTSWSQKEEGNSEHECFGPSALANYAARLTRENSLTLAQRSREHNLASDTIALHCVIELQCEEPNPTTNCTVYTEQTCRFVAHHHATCGISLVGLKVQLRFHRTAKPFSCNGEPESG